MGWGIDNIIPEIDTKIDGFPEETQSRKTDPSLHLETSFDSGPNRVQNMILQTYGVLFNVGNVNRICKRVLHYFGFVPPAYVHLFLVLNISQKQLKSGKKTTVFVLTLARTGGVGATPLRFFADSEKNGGA